MTRQWVRIEPGRRENLAAAGIALGAAAAVAGVLFYFGRILISREEVTPGRAAAERDDARELTPGPRIPSTRTRRS